MLPPVCFEGQYAKDRIPVMSNAFSIPERMKEIDDRFFVMFNKATQKFEVHVRGQQGTTLGCELPFPDLDYRALHYVRKHTAKSAREVARQIDIENERADKADVDRNLDRSNYKMKDALLWSDHHPSNETVIPKELVTE
jgi:hypothetical protein